MEIHPIKNGFIPKNSKTIIVGTFPPKSEYLNNPNFFFYSSVRNHLWNRMENIFPEFELKKTSTKLKNISFDVQEVINNNQDVVLSPDDVIRISSIFDSFR